MIHFFKYNIIGVLNTLITLAVVWVLHQLLDWNVELSNFLGFVAGGCNSYLCNRIWNFKSHNKKRSEIIRFVVVFLVSYGVNLLALELAAYTLANAAWCASFTTWISQFMKPTYFGKSLDACVQIGICRVANILFQSLCICPGDFYVTGLHGHVNLFGGLA